MSEDMDNEPRVVPFWSIGNAVSIRSDVAELRWDKFGRTWQYRLTGVEGWYDEEELTT